MSPEVLRGIAALHVEGEGGCCCVYERDGTCLAAAAASEWPGEANGEEGRRQARAAAEGGRPVEAELPGGRRSYAWPICRGRETIGAIWFAEGAAPAGPEPARRKPRAAARLIETLVEAGVWAERLEAIAAALDTADGAGEVRDIIAGGLLEWCDAAAGLLLLPGADGQESHTIGAAGSVPDDAGRLEPLAREAAGSGNPLFGEGDGLYHAALPLRIHGCGTGAVALEFAALDTDDALRAYLESLARLFAQALERAHLRDAARRPAAVRIGAGAEEAHAFLEQVLEQLPSGAAIAEAGSGRILLFNTEGKRLLRHSLPEVDNLAAYAQFQAVRADGGLYQLDDYPLVRALTRGESVHQEDMLYRRGDGSMAMLSINAAPIRDAAGRIVAAVCTFHDITERRRERDALRRQSQLIGLSRDAVITATADRVITSWNFGAEETYGWTAAEAIGRVMHNLLRTRSTVPIADIDAALLRHGRWDGEVIHTRKDGTEIVVESCQALVRDSGNVPTGMLEINRDVTARKRGEEALRESEQWLRYCQQATGVGIGDFDLVTGARKCSDQFYRLYGFEPGDAAFTREAWMDRIHPDDRERVAARMQAAREGGEPFETEFRVVAPGRPERWIAVKSTLYFDAGRPVRVIAAAMDITDRKRSEQAHYNAQKLESIGHLAGGIAHDFNNLLTGILGNASLILPEVDPDTADRVQAIISGAQKAADLTRQLLAYAGKGRYVVREFDLAGVVRDMTDLLRVSMPRRVELCRDLNSGAVRADAGQIQQIVMSLAMNSAEAMGEEQSGVVAVSTGAEQVLEPLHTATGDMLPPGDYSYLEVADNGCGMDAATRARVFDPFFTTKFIGRGLGLAAVAGIVRSHKGGILIETAPGKGTTFRVLLPAAKPRPVPAQPAVLVVDDEETVRDFLRRVLEGRGFEVACAVNGQEALRVLEERPGGICLVILDVLMPVMSGGETLASIRARHPDLKVLLTSGYSEDEAQRLCGGAVNAAFIQKPYTAQQLAEKLRSVLEDEGSRRGR